MTRAQALEILRRAGVQFDPTQSLNDLVARAKACERALVAGDDVAGLGAGHVLLCYPTPGVQI